MKPEEYESLRSEMLRADFDEELLKKIAFHAEIDLGELKNFIQSKGELKVEDSKVLLRIINLGLAECLAGLN